MIKSIVVMFFLTFSCSVFGQNINRFEDIIEDNSITIARYLGNEKDIIIPSEIDRPPGESIGDWVLIG